MLTKNKFITTYSVFKYPSQYLFSTSVTKLQKQMPATKKTASNNPLDDHDVPETSIPTEFSDNDAEVENDEKYETDCTTESDDKDNNDNHPRYTFSF